MWLSPISAVVIIPSNLGLHFSITTAQIKSLPTQVFGCHCPDFAAAQITIWLLLLPYVVDVIMLLPYAAVIANVLSWVPFMFSCCLGCLKLYTFVRCFSFFYLRRIRNTCYLSFSL